MIWIMLEWINNPDGWAITYRDGGFYIEPADQLPPGARLK